MLSQNNVLQVFVSPKKSAQVSVGLDLADLPVNDLGFFSGSTDKIVASGDGYFAFNDAGVIKKSNPVSSFSWAIQSYTASTAHTETITIPTLVVGKEYILNIKVMGENHNGEEVAKTNKIAVTGDTPTTFAAALVLQLNAKLKKEGNANFTITSSGAIITITALRKTFALGKCLGNFLTFKSSLYIEDGVSFAGTVTVAGTNGIGEGRYIQTKEFFARKNSDATSHNDFRTGFSTPNTNSSATGTYDVQGISGRWVEGELSDGIKGLPRQILIAFDTTGATPDVIS